MSSIGREARPQIHELSDTPKALWQLFFRVSRATPSNVVRQALGIAEACLESQMTFSRASIDEVVAAIPERLEAINNVHQVQKIHVELDPAKVERVFREVMSLSSQIIKLATLRPDLLPGLKQVIFNYDTRYEAVRAGDDKAVATEEHGYYVSRIYDEITRLLQDAGPALTPKEVTAITWDPDGDYNGYR